MDERQRNIRRVITEKLLKDPLLQPSEARFPDPVEVLHDANSIFFADLGLHDLGGHTSKSFLLFLDGFAILALIVQSVGLKEVLLIGFCPGVMCLQSPLFEHRRGIIEEVLIKSLGSLAFLDPLHELIFLQIFHQYVLIYPIGFSFF
jgi:hypothetical protein